MKKKKVLLNSASWSAEFASLTKASLALSISVGMLGKALHSPKGLVGVFEGEEVYIDEAMND